MEEIRITLETLYDILRNEKKREDLQRLSETFFYDLVGYLKEKKKLLDSKKEEDDLFTAGEREKLEYELRSIKRILKEIYEKREKKIIDIALNRSRTKSDLIDTSAMLGEEKELYRQLVKLLDGYRDGILMSLFRGEVPFFKKPEIRVKERQGTEAEENETKPEGEERKERKLEEKSEDEGKSEDKEKSREQPEMKKIRFIHAVPSFVWKDLKEYGPFEEGEETELSQEVAELIIEKGRAIEIK